MATVTRFDPFQLSTSLDPLEDVFKGFFRPLRLETAPDVQLKMDVTESDNAYVVRAEIPGVKKEDITVTIDGNQVSISAETRQEKDIKEGSKLVHSERYYGKIARRFTLASEIDQGAAEAKYSDGVLELTLPKKAASSAKRLDIH